MVHDDEAADGVTDETEESYIEFIFHPDRRGILEVVENIVKFLDYHSLICFKRSCKTVHRCLSKHPRLERDKYVSKLARDWASGRHTQLTVSVSGLVSCADFFTTGTHCHRVALGVDDKVQVCTLPSTTSTESGGQSITTDANSMTILPGSDSCITCVCVLNGFHEEEGSYAVASGSNDGKLLIWENGLLKVTKQLFGRIEELKWIRESRYLISAHFGGGGRSNDAGCISIRLVEQLDNGATMPVVFCLFQDIFPVFCVDMSPPGGRNIYLATVEWSGTFNNVHDGLLNVYKGFQKQPLVNVSLQSEATFTCCKFVGQDLLLTGGHDRKLRLWLIQDNSEGLQCPDDSEVIVCMMQFNGHNNVIMRLEVTSTMAVTRDLDGNIFVWDLSKVTDSSKHHKKDSQNFGPANESNLLLTKVKSLSKTVTCIAINERKIFLGSIGHFDVFDYWT